jgi:hypothetical protein
VTARNRDEWIIERWRVEPRWRPLADVEEPPLAEQAPPLWQDLTIASLAAALLWVAAAALFG